MSKRAPEFLQVIRSETKSLHDSLEELVGGNNLMSDDPDPAVYRNLIMAQYQFHNFVAEHIRLSFANEEHNVLDWPDCRRITNLKADLNDFETTVITSLIDKDVDINPNPAFSLGLCYVAEGSAMGNKMLFNHLKDKLGILGVSDLKFLKNEGIDFGLRWKEFIQLMLVYNQKDDENLLSGVIHGYKSFRSMFLIAKN